MSEPDRLGDAIRELARVMTERDRARMEFQIVQGGRRTVYEIRLISDAPVGEPIIELKRPAPAAQAAAPDGRKP